MKFLHYISLAVLAFSFSSCTSIAENIGWTGLIIMFAILMALFIYMFYLIQKRKRQGDKSLVNFSASVSAMLDKYENPENKIETLKLLIDRIYADEKYKKDTTWRDKVLAKTYLHLATQYNALGDDKKTLDTCTQILELTPDDAMTLYNRGSLYSNLGKYDKALDDLNKSIELVDDYASSYNNRGMILTKVKRYEEAIVDFDRALELEESAIIYYNRANTLKEEGKLDEALIDLRKGLDLCAEYDQDLHEVIEKAIDSILNKD